MKRSVMKMVIMAELMTGPLFTEKASGLYEIIADKLLETIEKSGMLPPHDVWQDDNSMLGDCRSDDSTSCTSNHTYACKWEKEDD